VVGHLTSKHKALSSNPSIAKEKNLIHLFWPLSSIKKKKTEIRGLNNKMNKIDHTHTHTHTIHILCPKKRLKK
jgi:hypothetical protein